MTADEVWKRAVDIAQIVSAIATFATVVVATRLWAKQYRPRLRVTLAETWVASEVMARRNYISVGVTNAGLTPLIVSGIQYRPHRWFKGRWFQVHDYRNPLSATLPLRMAPGETNQFFFPPDVWLTNCVDMVYPTYMDSFWARVLWRRGFRVEVLITTGETFVAKPTRAMIKKIETKVFERILSNTEGDADG